MFSRSGRKLWSRIVIVALVFAQLAVAAHACPLDAQVTAVQAVAATSGCDEMPDGMSTVCSSHCHDAAKTQAAFDVALAQPVFAVLLHAYLVQPEAPSSPLEPSLRRATSPPLNLSHCVLRL